MGCKKLSYYEKESLGVNWKIFEGGLEKKGDSDFFRANLNPFGMKLPSANNLHSSFGERHDYQGDFSEKDEETGWNAFELRMYDARIGRWLSVDPKGQYYSPYLGMGNNPTMRIDPDGGEDICPTCPQNSGDANIEAAINSDITYEYSTEHGISLETIEVQGQAWTASDEIAYLNKNPSYSSHNKGDYIYDRSDLITRAKIFNVGGVIADYLLKLEKEGNFGPITGENYYNQYVEKWETNSAFWYAIEEEYFSNVIPAGPGDMLTSANSFTKVRQPAGGRLKYRPTLKSGTTSPKNSWNRFLHQNKGKYSGGDWIKKAQQDYYKTF